MTRLRSSTQEPMFNISERAPVWLAGLFILIQAIIAFAPGSLVNAVALLGILRPLDAAAYPLIVKITSLIGHGFLHSGWGHVLMNSAMCVAFGVVTIRGLKVMSLSKRKPSNGELSFLMIFLFGVLAGGAAQWGWWEIIGAKNAAAVGASGGVSALFATAAWAMGGRDRLVHFGFGWAFINVVLVVAEPILGIGIAWAAHMGGYLGGALLAPLWVRASSTDFGVT